MIESSDTIAGSLDGFAATLAAAIDQPPDWTFAELCRRSAWPRQCALTGSQFGVLFAFREGDATAVQMTVQPNGADAETLDLLRHHPFGVDATAFVEPLLRALTEAGARGEMAIGTDIATRPKELRVYVGNPDDQDRHRLTEGLCHAGLLRHPDDEASATVLQMLRETGTLIGIARRFGDAPGQALYFAIDSDVLASSIVAMTPIVGAGVRRFQAFVTQLEGRADNIRWGWTAAQGPDLRVRYVKLEGSAQQAIADTDGALDGVPFYRVLGMMARNHELDLGLHTVSLAIGPRHEHRSSYVGLERPRSVATDVRPSPRPLRQGQANAVDSVAAVQRAILAIAKAQGADGSWSEFSVSGIGASDAWVTAFIGSRLADLQRGYALPPPLLPLAADFVARSWHEGLAFNRRSPVDADSTAHALLFWARLGRRDFDLEAHGALLKFQREDGSFQTFFTPGRVADSSWSTGHPEVTAVAIQALWPFREYTRVADAIARAFAWADAGWDKCCRSFWWDLDWYARLQWTKALQLAGKTAPLPLLAPSSGDRLTGTSSLDAAYLLDLCLTAKLFAEARVVASALLESQQESGLWPTKPVLRVVDEANFAPWNRPMQSHRVADGGCYSGAAIATALAAFSDSDRA